MNELLPLLILGSGGHARSCIDVIELEGRFQICGLVGQKHEVGKDVIGYQVLACDDELEYLGQLADHAFVAVGQIKMPDLRKKLFEKLISNGLILPTIISPFAHVSPHATIASGTIVMHGAIINAGARVGRNCIINSRALIEHDCNIGDHCHIATGAILNGGVSIGEASFIGSGAVLRQGVIVGKDCVIGMGQIVLKDCSDESRIPLWRIES